MKEHSFGDHSVGVLCEWMASAGLLAPPRGKHHTKAERTELKQALESSTEHLARGYQLILEAIKARPNGDEKVADFTLDPAIVAKLKKNKGFHELLSENCCMQGVFHIKPEAMTEIFAIGMDKLHRKEFEQSADIFQFALYLNPFVAWFWQGLARCWEGLQRYEEALQAHGVAINCEPMNTELYRCAAKLCLQLREFQKAKALLEYGLEQMASAPREEDHRVEKRDLEAMLAFIKRQV